MIETKRQIKTRLTNEKMPLTYYRPNMLAFRKLIHSTYLETFVLVETEVLLRR